MISPPAAKRCEKEIMFLHSFAAEEVCSASPAVENVQRLSGLSLHDGAKEQGIKFFGGEIFASGREIRAWKTGNRLYNNKFLFLKVNLKYIQKCFNLRYSY
jgi:hypothetical protein